MSVIPLLVCVYLASNYIFPNIPNIGNISIIIVIGIIIALIGFRLTKEIIDPVIRIASEAKIIAEGDLERRIELEREDEIGDLGTALNQLTRRIKENMSELKSYGEKTRQINLEIHKKVLVLSSLLHIGNLISAEAKLDEILSLIIEKVSQVEEAGCTFLLMVKEDSREVVMKSSYNLGVEELETLKIKFGEGLLGRAILGRLEVIIIDSQKPPSGEIEEFCNKFKIRNACIIPITSRGKTIGLLVTGNDKKDFVYKDDTIETIKIFAKQVSIAVENDFLLHKAEELEIKDELTGLFNQSYIRTRLDEEIRRAILHQRPCSFILFKVDDFEDYRKRQGELAAESALKRIALILEESVGQIDKVARFGDDEFAILLPERNKKEASNIAESIRKRIEEFIFPGDESKGSRRLTVSGGVSENPIDGISADELINKARRAIEIARSQGKNRIVS
jgi:diguanylate cyclase (GGDEF)-like protein